MPRIQTLIALTFFLHALWSSAELLVPPVTQVPCNAKIFVDPQGLIYDWTCPDGETDCPSTRTCQRYAEPIPGQTYSYGKCRCVDSEGNTGGGPDCRTLILIDNDKAVPWELRCYNIDCSDPDPPNCQWEHQGPYTPGSYVPCSCTS